MKFPFHGNYWQLLPCILSYRGIRRSYVPGHVPGAHLPCRNPRARRPRPPSRGRTVVQGPVLGSLGSWLIAKRTLIVLNHTRVLTSIVAAASDFITFLLT